VNRKLDELMEDRNESIKPKYSIILTQFIVIFIHDGLFSFTQRITIVQVLSK